MAILLDTWSVIVEEQTFVVSFFEEREACPKNFIPGSTEHNVKFCNIRSFPIAENVPPIIFHNIYNLL